jgi:hypothetical protein
MEVSATPKLAMARPRERWAKLAMSKTSDAI